MSRSKKYHPKRNTHIKKEVMLDKKLTCGELVYFHAYANSSDENTYFMCKGYIVREPTEVSNVYKLVVISVYPQSILCGRQDKLASSLLGRKIARDKEQLFKVLKDFIAPLYSLDIWITLNDNELNKVRSILRKKKE